MTEQIADILKLDVIVSKKPGAFSTPTEITNHLNRRLDSSYSTRAIAECLKSLGWQVSGKKRVKRNGKACNFYFLANDIKSKALLSPSAKTNTQSETKSKGDSSEGESLSSIDKRFRSARADKERHLASTRSVETNTAKHRSEHLRIELETKRGELISIEEVVRGWNEAAIALRTALYTMPLKYGSRWASEQSAEVIEEEFTTELDNVLRKLVEAEEEAIKKENEKDFATDEEPKSENEA